MNQPGSLAPGHEPAPSYPPVPSLPKVQSLGSPKTTEKEIGTVSPMQVHLGSMLGKGCGVGIITVSVARWAWAVPLGIRHNPQRVGGLCAPNHTSAPAVPGTSEPAVWSGVDSGTTVAAALLQLQKPTQVPLRAFLAVLDRQKTSRAGKKFVKKNGHMANLASRRAQKWGAASNYPIPVFTSKSDKMVFEP